MKKYRFRSSWLVEANEREVHFFTQTSPPGIISTALWKYQIDTDTICCCFKIQKRLLLWKYPAIKANGDLQYIGIEYPGTACVVGFNSEGKELFKVEPGKHVDICGPVFDTDGNLYLSVDEQWIFCLSPMGELRWKWRSNNAISNISAIEKYWIYNNRLYVITCGQIYVISASGKVEENYLADNFKYPSTKYKICGEQILFIDMKYKELLCYDFKGRKLWQSNANKNEMYLDIEACEKNIVCVKAMRLEDDSTILYIFDEKGNKLGSIHEEWSGLLISLTQEVVMWHGQDVHIYSPDGQKLLQSSGKKYTIFANVLEDKLISIVESRGKIAIVKQDKEMKRKPVITKLPEINEEDEAIENENLWRKEISETILLNLELFSKKSHREILEIKVVCVPFEFMEIRALTDEQIWEDATIKNIPIEDVTEKERDAYKECCYRNDIVWTEFCEECSEGRIRTVMESACNIINEKLNILVKLELL